MRLFFANVRGYPVWGWLLFGVIVASVVYGAVFGLPPRCSDDGCWIEW